MKYKILIVEDDSVIASSLESGLATWGYETKAVTDFSSVLADFAAFCPHLVLLDISLPFFNGYHRCREIRKISSVPVIFISSSSDNMNVVLAVNMGGDDFIPKPFDMDVLAAKIQALLRRSYDFVAAASFIEAGDALLNTESAVFSFKGEIVNLTKNEYRIIEVLMKNKGKIISREQLMLKLWETDSFVDDNTLTVNVTRLRKKLSEVGADDFIKTRKGLGYSIE